MSSPALRAGRSRRPAVLDGAFLIVRRNVRLMLGLPLVVAGGAAAYVLAGVGLWVALGNTTAQTAQIVLTVLMGLLGLLLLQQCLVWMTAILSRVSLHTVLGEGFAPTTAAVNLRTSLPLLRGRSDAGEVYASAAAEADQARRARTAHALRNLGISVVQAPPARFAPDLAGHYLALKNAGRL